MNTLHRRVARLEKLGRDRFSAREEADGADNTVLRERLGADVLAGLKAGRIDPVSVLPLELVAYLNGDLTALSPGFAAELVRLVEG